MYGRQRRISACTAPYHTCFAAQLRFCRVSEEAASLPLITHREEEMENLNRAGRCIRLEAQLEIGILLPQLLGLCPLVEAELVLDTMMKLFI